MPIARIKTGGLYFGQRGKDYTVCLTTVSTDFFSLGIKQDECASFCVRGTKSKVGNSSFSDPFLRRNNSKGSILSLTTVLFIPMVLAVVISVAQPRLLDTQIVVALHLPWRARIFVCTNQQYCCHVHYTSTDKHVFLSAHTRDTQTSHYTDHQGDSSFCLHVPVLHLT